MVVQSVWCFVVCRELLRGLDLHANAMPVAAAVVRISGAWHEQFEHAIHYRLCAVPTVTHHTKAVVAHLATSCTPLQRMHCRLWRSKPPSAVRIIDRFITSVAVAV